MKKLTIFVVLLISVLAAAAAAASDIDYAEVRSVRPIENTVTHIEYREVCRRVAVPVTVMDPVYSRQRDTFAPFVGALAGGALARGITKGEHRNEAAIVGAVIGAYTQRNRTREVQTGYQTRIVQQTQNQCSMEEYPRTFTQVDGYEVTYEYQGDIHTVVLPDMPGDRVQIVTQVRAY